MYLPVPGKRQADDTDRGGGACHLHTLETKQTKTKTKAEDQSTLV